MKYLIFICFCAAFLLSLTEATLGWDGIQAVDVNGFKCLSQNGYSFYIARVWRSIGSADPTGIQNIKNARQAGWKYVDGYIFPCFKKSCGSAKDQVKATLDRLSKDNAKIGMLWLDVEVENWPADKSANQAFILDMAKQAEEMGTKVGIYTSKNNWDQIVGNWSGVSDKPLWYAHWDGQQNFNGFKAFGGWRKPAIHQFEGDVKGPCGVSMDKNWYP
uniref:Lysozyme n=1 Tax=Panagrolaimus sp. PS1159 TaxID=55785 RepID=A0AC35GRK8_9BILA